MGSPSSRDRPEHFAPPKWSRGSLFTIPSDIPAPLERTLWRGLFFPGGLEVAPLRRSPPCRKEEAPPERALQRGGHGMVKSDPRLHFGGASAGHGKQASHIGGETPSETMAMRRVAPELKKAFEIHAVRP